MSVTLSDVGGGGGPASVSVTPCGHTASDRAEALGTADAGKRGLADRAGATRSRLGTRPAPRLIRPARPAGPRQLGLARVTPHGAHAARLPRAWADDADVQHRPPGDGVLLAPVHARGHVGPSAGPAFADVGESVLPIIAPGPRPAARALAEVEGVALASRSRPGQIIAASGLLDLHAVNVTS
jgi:hypothetical protein